MLSAIEQVCCRSHDGVSYLQAGGILQIAFASFAILVCL